MEPWGPSMTGSGKLQLEGAIWILNKGISSQTQRYIIFRAVFSAKNRMKRFRKTNEKSNMPTAHPTSDYRHQQFSAE